MAMHMHHALEIYQQLALILTPESSEAQTLHLFAEWLLRVYQPQRAAIFLLDNGGERWHLRWSHGLGRAGDGLQEKDWPRDASPWQADLFRSPEPGQPTGQPTGQPIVQSIVQPIGYQSQELGYVWLVPGALDVDDAMRMLLDTTASAVGKHLWWMREQNRTADKLHRLEKQSQWLAVLNRIGQALATTLDIGELCKIAHAEIAQLMDCPNFGISTYDARRQELCPLYLIGDGVHIDSSHIPAVPLEPETGAQSKVVVSKQPLRVPDLEALRAQLKTYHRIESTDRRLARAAIIVPMVAGERVIGTVQIQSYEPDTYTQADEDLLSAIANQLGVALENARLYAESQWRLRDMEGINRIYKTLQTETDRTAVIANLLDESLALLDMHAGAIWLYDPKDDTLVEHVSRGWFQDLCVHRMKPNQGLTGRVFSSGERIVVDEFYALSNVLAASRPQIPKNWGGIALPLMAQQKPIGVLFLSVQLPRRLTPEEINLASVLGKIMGSALQNSALQRQIRTQAMHLQQVLDAVSEGLVLLTADFSVVLANPSALAYLAQLADHPIGHEDRLTHLGGEAVADLLARAAVKGDRRGQPPVRPPVRPTEITIQSRDANIYEIVAYPLRMGEPETQGTQQDPASDGWVVLLRDVTELRHAQERLQDQERLAAVGQMAAGIAHDFNNIIAVIVLYAQLMQRSEGLSTQDQDRIATIHAQADHAAKLVQQILDFSRKSVMRREAIDLGQLMQTIVAVLRRTLPENIQVDLIADTDCWVLADPTRLQQAMTNLAVNARDAMPDGGSLRFELSHLILAPGDPPPLPEMPPDHWIKIRVVDSGIGISADSLPHIFEPFFTSKMPGQGTGLGLSQVYGIVMQHQGHIDVKSQSDTGTAFHIYLPLHPLQSRPEKPVASPVSPSQEETILVVEDNPATGTAMQSILTEQGYRVHLAANGHRALDLMATHGDQVALVLTDLVMPGMGGVELSQQMHQHFPGVKIVAMTGYPQMDNGEELLEQGFDAWMQKPFDMDELLTTIQQVLDRNCV